MMLFICLVLVVFGQLKTKYNYDTVRVNPGFSTKLPVGVFYVTF